MLNSEALHAMMYKHFPRWMDIRKRAKKSDGGRLLLSTAEEVAEVQNAIEDYKKDYFIDGYMGREDEVVAFLYKGHIGSVAAESIQVTSPPLNMAEDIASFYATTGQAYLEEGYLFFRTEDISTPDAPVKITIDGFATTINIEKIHVWNVFDEFATFLGVQRHEGESNLDLEKRILSVFKRPMNSTEAGLRNAILNELMIIDPSLSEEEIEISRPTPANLMKPYKEFKSVLEKLDLVNRDIYRTKRWDIDPWNYAFKSVEYIPHAWDIALDAYQNGIGFKDDLEVSVTSPDDTTNARISFYSESDVMIQEYIKQRTIRKKIKIGLTKYDNALKSKVAKYKITAAPARELTSENIWIQASERFEGEESRYIQDIISEGESRAISIVDHSVIKDNKRYELSFKPRNAVGPMTIDKCDIIQNSSRTSLLKPGGSFLLNGSGQLYNKNVRFFGKHRHQFTSYQNIVNGSSGIEIDDLSAYGVLTLDTTGMQNERLWLGFSSERAIAESRFLSMASFVSASGNRYSSPPTSNAERSFTFAAKANGFSLDVEVGSFAINATIDGIKWAPVLGSAPYTFNIPDSLEPRDISVTISPTTPGMLTIKDVKYSNYEIVLGVESGNIVSVNDGIYLPSSPTNTLYITMETQNVYTPRIEYLHIGQKPENEEYKVIIEPGVKKKIDVKTDCVMTLTEIDSTGVSTGVVVSPYEPYRMYVSESDSSYIKLNLSSYSSIISIKSVNGRLEMINTGTETEYLLRIRKGDAVSKVTINGERTALRKEISLAEALNASPQNGDKIYVSRLHKWFFVVGSDLTPRAVSIDQIRLESSTTEAFTIKGLPDDVECFFETQGSETSIFVGASYTGRFKSMYFAPKDTTTYIAYNEKKMVTAELRNVEIVDVFHPFLPVNQNMVYTVSSMDATGETEVKFESVNDNGFLIADNWSIGRGKLRILWSLSMNNPVNYGRSELNIEETFTINEVVPLNPIYTLTGGEIVEISKYMLSVPEGMKISYRKRSFGDTIESAPQFYSSEILVREEDGFNKLSYANIDEILYVGLTPWTGNNASLPSSSYSVMKDEGILIWLNNQVAVGNPVYIVYTIRIPDSILIDVKALYRLVEYRVEAYREIGYLDVYNLADGDQVSLVNNSYHKIGSKTVIFCDRAGFEGIIEDNIVTFRRDAANNVVAVKTGYFYADGQEYYMFSNETSDTINQFQDVTLSNVDLDGGEMILNKETKNYVKNSWMELGNAGDVFSRDFENEDPVLGVSRLNSITACSSFNHWKTFGSNLYLVPGMNGTGIKVEPLVENGYAFIDITDQLLPETFLTLYLSDNAEAYIGRERKYAGMSFSRSTSIEPLIKIERTIANRNVLECQFVPEKGYRHYLIIKGSGVVDDIVLQHPGDNHRYAHTKMISALQLNIEERILSDYVSRLFFVGNSGGEAGAEMDREGNIINSSNIDWGITKTRSYDEPSSWARCQFTKVNVVNGICYTSPNQAGVIETDPIYVGDRRMIKNMVFEINDVLFDNMKGFITRIKMCDTYGGDYRTVSTHKDNIGSVRGDHLMPYIKFVIEMPAGKVINDISIYTEYKADKNVAPIEVPISTGSFTTEVLDTHYAAKYKVKGIEVESVSNINDVAIYIRGSKEAAQGEVWTDWKEVQLTGSLGIKNQVIFDGYRFFQMRVALRNRKASIKIKHIDLGVV